MKLFEILRKKRLTISFAESMTGGYLSTNITKNNHASEVFIGSIIAYKKEVKEDILHVKEETINKYTVVSKEVAWEMAEGLRKIISSDIYVSITGNASSTYEINTNKNEFYASIFYKDKVTEIHEILNSKNRITNINYAIIKITEEILKIIEK